MKGYVIRGRDDMMRPSCVKDFTYDGIWFAAEPHAAKVLAMPEAMGAWSVAHQEGTNFFAGRIFAVAADGTETALPGYEEALAEIQRLRIENSALDGAQDAACKEAVRLAHEGAELRAENTRVATERDALMREGIAERDRHRNIVATLEGERADVDKAWARFAKATAADMDSMHMMAETPTVENVRDHGKKNAEYWAARQALRDLGVDVDTLLS